MLKAWSYSRLSIFEQCKLRARLAFVDKIPEPVRPLPPGKTEHANDRGARVHEAAEIYARGELGIDLIPELGTFKDEFLRLREFAKTGRAAFEGDWAFNNQWLPVAWNSSDVWVRIKLDALVFLTDEHALVVDYKTGRKRGNEVKHAEQGQLYQLATFLKYPDLQQITVEFWYTDQDDITRYVYTREQGLRFLSGFSRRGSALTSCSEWTPNPNMFSCRYCPYGPKGTNHCTVGV